MSISKVKKELRFAIRELEIRGIIFASKWLSELLVSMDEFSVPDNNIFEKYDWDFKVGPENGTLLSDKEIFAKSLFLIRDFKQCEYVLTGENSNYSTFLKNYAVFLLSKTNDSSAEMTILSEKMAKSHEKGELDSFSLYLYGMVLKSLSLSEKAKTVLIESLKLFPFNWSAWQALNPLINSKAELEQSGTITSHWTSLFFILQTSLTFNGKYDALQKCVKELINLFPNSLTVQREKIKLAYEQRYFDYAQAEYENLLKKDPFNVEAMDNYSNILFVKDCQNELAKIAKKFEVTHKFHPETALIVANHLSLKKKHEDAVNYFKRAIKLNPQYEDAWVLLGHEFIEVRKDNDAISAYRTAISLNGRNYRAWYGLGQINEMKNELENALFYYQKAAQFKPDDSRMWNAMGTCYKKQGRLEEAVRCFLRSEDSGDEENIAVLHLAEFYLGGEDEENKQKYCTKVIEKINSEKAADMDMSTVFAKCLFVVTESDSKEKRIESAEQHLSDFKKVNKDEEMDQRLDEIVTKLKEEDDEIMESTEVSDENEGISPKELDFGE